MLTLQDEEIPLSLRQKSSYQERNFVRNAWENVTEHLTFVESSKHNLFWIVCSLCGVGIFWNTVENRRCIFNIDIMLHQIIGYIFVMKSDWKYNTLTHYASVSLLKKQTSRATMLECCSFTTKWTLSLMFFKDFAYILNYFLLLFKISRTTFGGCYFFYTLPWNHQKPTDFLTILWI